MLVAALGSIVISVLIVWSLFSEAWTFMINVEWSQLWGQIGWFPRRGIYDMPTLLMATLITTVVAMIVATPLGLGAAVYLSEYAKPGVRKVLKPTLEVLAGIPSVVLGFFALQWIAPQVVTKMGGPSSGSLMAAGLGVGILTIPLVASISEDAMSAVPRELREASFGLGARKVTTTTRVVLPAAISGLVAAFIVATSRAVGETMVVFLAGGAADAALYTSSPLDPGLTMTAAMASLASGTDQVVGEGLTFQSLFFVGFVLFFITLALNMIGNRFVARIRETY
jgi:phosphate transport system permease protein